LSHQTEKTRELVLWFFLPVLFSLLFVRLIYFQITEADFSFDKIENRISQSKVIKSSRGKIVDRNDRVLAEDIIFYDIGIDLNYFSYKPNEIKFISNLLNIEEQNLRERSSNQRLKFIQISKKVNREKVEALKKEKIQGLVFDERYYRNYPEGEAFSQLVGITDINNDGLQGIELSFQKSLDSSDGRIDLKRDGNGKVIEEVIVPEKDGDLIKLSIDSDYQFIVFDELKRAVIENNASNASAIMIDLDSEEILAITNYPSFNPNDRKSLSDISLVTNRASISLLEPGSVLKPLSISLALDDELINEGTLIDTNPGWVEFEDYRTEDFRNYGIISVSEVISKSSNVGTVKICSRMNKSRVISGMRSFGIGEYFSEMFLNHREGFLPGEQNISLRGLVSLCYGYGLQTTLLHIAKAYTGILNDGIEANLKIISSESNEISRRILKKETSNTIKNILIHTVNNGTGKLAKVKGGVVGGKTGTSFISKEQGYDEDSINALFVGFIEKNNERYLLAIMVQEPKNDVSGGSDVAAPIFSNVFKSIFASS
jgi:cell division protein FtsI (penicillin-binding protein 3)